MANTSRKRPPPSTSSSSAASSAAVAAATSNNMAVPLPTSTCGIDALLAKYARHLPPGASISIQLIKGPTTSSVDPVAARKASVKEAKRAAARAARLAAATSSTTGMGAVGAPNSNLSSFNSSGMSSGNDDSDANPSSAIESTTTTNNANNNHPGTTPLPFPRMAKFIETVTPPDFTKTLKDGRMYEEEVPKAKDESDEDESTAYQSSKIDSTSGDATNPSSSDAARKANNKNKKRRWRRFDPRPRRWVLQEKSEFFDKIRKRRMRTSATGSVASGENDDEEDTNTISNQYHGVVEANASKYVILSVAPSAISTASDTTTTTNGMPMMPSEQINVQPIYGFHTFSQPYKFASLTMEEAEHAIEKQREVMSRYMMHGRLASQSSSNEAAAALQAGVTTMGGGGTRGRGLSRSIGPPPKAMSRARLLGKLAGSSGGGGGGGRGGDEDDDDDVMGDVRFSSSKVGGTSKGRKELLSSLGDEGITADDDGVLGGANDSEFGGRRRFARVSTAKEDADAPQGAKGGGGERNTTSTGFEAAAMEEGFYQRDVAAEYEALDYDAEEQFDDDDVNVGEDEMMDDGGGYGGDYHDSGDDNMLDSDDEDAGSGSDTEALKGMATASGLKAMLAKARGESPVTTPSGFDSTNSSVAGASASALDTSFDNVSGGISGTESATSLSGMGEMMKKKPASPTIPSSSAIVEKDKDGKRLITLEAVRREIWLNNGAITSKRLTKKFDVTKKNPERQALFKTIIMELCTIKKDADGNKLVLKQHYSKI
ncbi:hypothetical protein ACHAWU_003800 [Discostella pseudostelligera]|uniref:Transcription initiation factor IIF subunit alpha n=1 Tax=Discostella pseudostelligera TaxID=259834 RepID=A0ABD3MWV3_9STRA